MDNLALGGQGMNQQKFEQIFQELSLRRLEVLQQLMLGRSDAAIADALGIQPTTVRKHIERVCQEFGLHNGEQEGRRYKRSELVALLARYKPELLAHRSFGKAEDDVEPPKQIGQTVLCEGDHSLGYTQGWEVIKTPELSMEEISDDGKDLFRRIKSFVEKLISFFAEKPKAKMKEKVYPTSLNQEQIPDDNKDVFYQISSFVEKCRKEELERKFQTSSLQEKHQIAEELNQLGYERYLEANFSAAKVDLEWAVKFNPEMGVAHYHLGLTCERLWEPFKAIYHYRIAMKRDNKKASIAATSNLARLEIRRKNFYRAIVLIQSILSQGKITKVPDLFKAPLYKNLGWAYYELGNYQQGEERLRDYEEAKKHLLKSLELRNEYASAYYLCAKIQQALGNEESALLLFTKFLNLDNNKEKVVKGEWRSRIR